MGTKAQHTDEYRLLPAFLRSLREDARMTQRNLARSYRDRKVGFIIAKSGIDEWT